MSDELDRAWEAMPASMRSHPGVKTLYRLAFEKRSTDQAATARPDDLAGLSDLEVMRIWDQYVSATNAYEDNGVGFVRLLVLELANRRGS